MNKDIMEGGIIDAHFSDLLDAYRNCAKLHEAISNPIHKRAIRRIQFSIKLAVNNLSPLGVHAKKWFQEAEEKYSLSN
jgi:hypothetical protein